VDQRERLTVNWVRVLGLDGRVISDHPAHEQETSAPVPMQYPVYTDTKIRRLTLGGVEPGTIVDFSYTTEVIEPVMPGSFTNSWSVTTGSPVRRSRLIVDVPASLTPRIQEWNVRFPRETRTERGRRVYLWATTDVPAGQPEPFAAWPNDVDVSITVGAPITWDDLARWYWNLARDRYALTPDVEQVFRLATVGAGTRADSLRALYRWVAQEIRYVSLSLGRGGYQPRPAAEVIRTKLGDCKDKATLLITLAARMNLKAFPVIVSLSGRPDSALPTPSAFDHVIVAVEDGGKRVFADPTAELSPLGELSPALQGEFGLLVRQDGRGELVTLPETPPSANGTVTLLSGELKPDGSFSGHYSQTASGSAQYRLRESLSSAAGLTASERERMARSLAGSVFEGASGDSLTVFDGRDLEALPRISLAITAPRAAARSGPDYIFKLPVPSYSLSHLVTELEARPSRRYPIDVEELFGPTTMAWVLEITLPEAWRPRLPPNVEATSRFGSYRSAYTLEGRTLRVERQVGGRRGVEPPEAVSELIAWLKAIADDDVPYIVFETARD
jgi:transglutaminase-like putative cysteine protease